MSEQLFTSTGKPYGDTTTIRRDRAFLLLGTALDYALAAEMNCASGGVSIVDLDMRSVQVFRGRRAHQTVSDSVYQYIGEGF
jgi:hypothetical protein